MKTATILTICLLVVGAVAVPAMAQPDDRPDRPDKDERREAMQDKREERHNKTIERAEKRCAEFENRTGRDVPACDRLEEIHNNTHQARRAAHALLKAIDALEHRVVVLEKLEVKFMEKLEGENLTANQTAAFEAKLVRIQEAQNKTLEKIEKMEDRLDRLKEKFEKVRDHVGKHAKVLVCHVDDEGENHTIRVSARALKAHLAHNDTKGACPDFEAEHDDSLAEEEDEAEGDEEAKDEDGNETAPPS